MTPRAAQASHATQPDQLNALASVAATSPVGRANVIFDNAEAKALGLATANTSGRDGSIGVNSSACTPMDVSRHTDPGVHDVVSEDGYFSVDGQAMRQACNNLRNCRGMVAWSPSSI